MAKIKDGIFGGFSGRIGNVVGFFRNGKYYIRSVASSAKNPRTKAQQTQRGKFRLASKLVAIINPFIQKGFSTVPGKTPRGAAMSYNMRSAISGEHPDLHINYPHVTVAKGMLIPVEEPKARFDDSGNLLFEWRDNSGEGNAKATDRAMLLAIVPDKKDIVYKLRGTERRVEEDLLELPESFDPTSSDESLYVYLTFISKDEKLVSDSLYLSL